MAENDNYILKACKIRYIRLSPRAPNAKFKPENPQWELQIYTTDVSQKNEWEAQVEGLKMKLKMESHDGAPEVPTWFFQLHKNSIGGDGTPNKPVIVVNGGKIPIDPKTVGFGSTANVRISSYKWKFGGKEGTSFNLFAVQVTKHLPYTPQEYDDFEETETEYVEPIAPQVDPVSEY